MTTQKDDVRKPAEKEKLRCKPLPEGVSGGGILDSGVS